MDLRGHRFFNHFPKEQAAELTGISRLKRIRAGRVIFEENDPPDAIYLVLEGRVVLTKRAPGGYAQVIAVREPDDYFGEIAVLDGSGRSARAVADGPVLLAKLPRRAFLRILSRSPWHSVVRLFNHVSENLRATNDRFVGEVVRKEKIMLIGEMANGMIHDFKGPFTTIRLAIDMLARKSTDPGSLEMCQVVLRQIHRLSGMVQEVLEFAKGEAQLNQESIRLGSLFEAIADTHREALAQTKTRLTIRPTSLVVAIDHDRFSRVLQNLVTNAIEAIGREKRGRISLSAARKPGWVEISVADNGPGIATPIRSTLFEPFVSHGKRGGTGLGLAIAKSVVEAHGGAITYRSRPRKGTSFLIRVPLHR